MLKRLFQTALVLVAVSALIFFTVRLSPADPIASITKGKPINDQARTELTRRFHLDKGVGEQYAIWVSGMLHGDFGDSYQYQQPVTFLIGQRARTTLTLSAYAIALAISISLPLGVATAVKANTVLDKALSTLSLVFVASPTFLIGIVFMMIFALRLHWFPSMGTGSFRHYVLPAAAMALNMVALTSRITRQSMIDQLSSDYIATVRAKGMGSWRIVVSHALKNALIPIITVASLQIGGMLVGAVLVEAVFAMGGLGDLLITSIKNADYPVVQAITILLIAVYCGLNLIVDMAYAVIDPRIRLK
jgi:peptide/nickel transport system permease protein